MTKVKNEKKKKEAISDLPRLLVHPRNSHGGADWPEDFVLAAAWRDALSQIQDPVQTLALP